MITPANFQIFLSNGNTLMGAAYSETPTRYQQFCDTLPSTTEQEIYGWTGMLPKPREWDGPRVVNEAAPQTYTVVNRAWEQTLSIDRFRLDDDKLGVYYRELLDLARQAKRQPDYWIRDLLEALGSFSGAAAQAGLDGLSAFNTAHPIDIYDASKGTYSNDFVGGAGTSASPGGALSPNAFATAVEAMQKYKAEDGERMAIMPSLMMVPPDLRLEANLILKAAFFAAPAWGTIAGQVGTADNVLNRFGVDLLIHELLTSSTKWYLFDTTKARKPLVWQQREAATMATRTAENDPVVFDTHHFLWGYWGRGAPAWAFSWLFARSG